MSKPEHFNDLIALYITECGQLIRKFEKLIIDSDQSGLLQDPQELFRILHTLKGTSAMMEFAPLVDISHSFEDILSVLKSSPLSVNGDFLQAIVDSGLEFTAYFDLSLGRITNGEEPEKNEGLEKTITGLSAKLGIASKTKPNQAPEAPLPMSVKKDGSDGKTWVLIKIKKCPLPNIRASIIAKSALKLCSQLTTDPKNIDKLPEYADTVLNNGFELGFIPLPSVSVSEIVKKLSAQPYVVSCTVQGEADTEKAPLNTDTPEALQTVTVPQTLINNLIGFMDEITSAESAVEDYIQKSGYDSRQMQELLSTLRRTVAEANIITSRIGIRDVGSVFIQMQRGIRTMAKEQGKDIKTEVIGNDVTVDKSILEILSDSMIHMVRNAVDHGIETPAERKAKGKSPTGKITLSAVKKNSYITVTVSDDGGGINRRAVLEKAEKCGTLTKPKELYTANEADSLILSSGLSTNEKVTRYSGRGVGLDTVVRRIRRAGGRISVKSAEGLGTSFTLDIPISLLMIDGIEVVLPDGSELIIPANAVQHIDGSDYAPEGYEFRGETYNRLLFPGEYRGENIGKGFTLILERDFGRRFIRTEKVSTLTGYYVKPMPRFVTDTLGKNDIYSGCVLCSDSKLRCVLDIAKLIGVSENGKLSER